MRATLLLLPVGYRDFGLGWSVSVLFWGGFFFFLKSENYCYKYVVTHLRWVQVLLWDICILSDSLSLALFLFFFIEIPSNSHSSELANLLSNTGIQSPWW